MPNAQETSFCPFEKLFAKQATLLERWRGGTVVLWEYRFAHRFLIFRVTHEAKSGFLEIGCGDVTSHTGPIEWPNSLFALEMRRKSIRDIDYVLVDERAGFEVKAGHVGINVVQTVRRGITGPVESVLRGTEADGRIHTVLRSVNAVDKLNEELDRMKGSFARLWSYGISHQHLEIALDWPGERGRLKLILDACFVIRCGSTWSFHEPRVEVDEARRSMCLVDEPAGIYITCESLHLVEVIDTACTK